MTAEVQTSCAASDTPPGAGEPPELWTKVAIDLACVKCGYNLRMLPGDGRCPECGAPVEWSLPGCGPPVNAPELAAALRITAAGLTTAVVGPFCWALGSCLLSALGVGLPGDFFGRGLFVGVLTLTAIGQTLFTLGQFRLARSFSEIAPVLYPRLRLHAKINAGAALAAWAVVWIGLPLWLEAHVQGLRCSTERPAAAAMVLVVGELISFSVAGVHLARECRDPDRAGPFKVAGAVLLIGLACLLLLGALYWWGMTPNVFFDVVAGVGVVPAVIALPTSIGFLAAASRDLADALLVARRRDAPGRR
jgi:hypothetical protein